MSEPVAPDGTAIGHSIFSCLKKRKYVNEPEAWSVIFKMRAKGQDTERLQPYQCDHCKQWHLGRTPTRLRCELQGAKI
jgi:hypothetical protein